MGYVGIYLVGTARYYVTSRRLVVLVVPLGKGWCSVGAGVGEYGLVWVAWVVVRS